MVDKKMQDDRSNKTFEQDTNDMKLVEAILFVSGRFLNLRELVSYSDLNPLLLKEIIEKLKSKFNEDKNSSIRIIEKDSEEQKSKIWKMDVKQEFSNLANRLAGGSSEFSKAEQETLAIIAFKQPVKQSIVVKIRGNKSYDHIKKFQDLNLIKKKKLGHTYELSLSDEFYDYFQVSKEKSKEDQLNHIKE